VKHKWREFWCKLEKKTFKVRKQKDRKTETCVFLNVCTYVRRHAALAEFEIFLNECEAKERNERNENGKGSSESGVEM
jgi:hypothetical protein